MVTIWAARILPRSSAMKKALTCLVAIAVLGACSAIKPYPDRYAKNVRINTATDSSLFSKVRTAVDVYSIEGACETSYQGTVQLRGSTTMLGLPSERPAYLVFVFEGSSFLGGTQSSTTYETVFRPEADKRYEFEVAYADRIYGVLMRKAAVGDETGAEVERQPLADC